MIFEMRMRLKAKQQASRVGCCSSGISTFLFRTALAFPCALCPGLQVGQARQIECRPPSGVTLDSVKWPQVRRHSYLPLAVTIRLGVDGLRR